MNYVYFIISLAISSLAFIVTYYYYGFFEDITFSNYKYINNEIIKFYGNNLRGNLFSGFLALGGFIFSLKAFILVTMKQNVYDSENYQAKWIEVNGLENTQAYFLPLKELNAVLYMTVLLSIISAIVNITVGLLPNISVVYICIFMSIVATVYLMRSLWLIKGNLDTWFEYLRLKEK